MPTAVCVILDRPGYLRPVFVQGLQACGFEVMPRPVRDPKPDDVLVVWNRSSENDKFAVRYGQAGCKVIVAENGYFGKQWQGGIWYALARDNHAGAGQWPDAPGRWDRWNVPLAPWRSSGDEIVILAQRGIGSKTLRSPSQWEASARERLQRISRRPIRMRRHPGLHPTKTALEDDLRNAWCCVTWASGAALKALLMGVPVFHECPSWIGASAARPFEHDIEDPFLGDRLPMLRRLAGAMWNVDEIACGEPFRCLLEL